MKRRALKAWLVLAVVVLLWATLRSPLGTQAQGQGQGPKERELLFQNGDVRLAGSLYLPAGEGPFPAAVIVHGSGAESRTPYVPDALLLADQGVAALIYDKRGTGDSSGDWERSSLQDLQADALAGVHAVQSQPEIDPERVGLLGSSQGAWLAPFAAAQDEAVAFIVQVTGSATALANQEMWNGGNDLAGAGFSPRATAVAVKAFHLLYSSGPLVRRGLLPLGDLWFVHYDPYLDPAAAWPRVDAPALILYGGRDALVPTERSLEIVRPLLAEYGNADSRVVVFPTAGHALGGASRNQDPAYAALVPAWIKAVTGEDTLPEMPFADTVPPGQMLRWYGNGAAVTPWYATAPVQLGLILLFAVLFLAGLVVSLWPRNSLTPGARLALGATSAVNLALLLGLVNALNYLLNAAAEGYGPPVPLAGLLFALALGSVALAAALLVVAFRARRDAAWTARLRGFVWVMAGTAVAFAAFLWYWQVLGPPL